MKQYIGYPQFIYSLFLPKWIKNEKKNLEILKKSQWRGCRNIIVHIDTMKSILILNIGNKIKMHEITGFTT